MPDERDEELALLYRLHDRAFERVERGEASAEPLLQALEDMIVERETRVVELVPG